jgi:hypothetical protein
VGRLTDIVLELIERLRRGAGHAVLLGRAADLEALPQVRVCRARLVVAELAGMPARIGGVPQHPVRGPDVNPGRDDRLEAVRQHGGELLRIHGHTGIMRCRRAVIRSWSCDLLTRTGLCH